MPRWNPEIITGFAKDVVSLAERLIRPTDVFVIMSLAEKGHLVDAYNAFVRVCKNSGFTAFKVNEHLDAKQRIVAAITSWLRRAAFVIADITDPRPNVYYEIGYAHALGKDIIVTVQEGTVPPFDIFDVPIVFWNSQDMLEKKLEAEVRRIGQSAARTAGGGI